MASTPSTSPGTHRGPNTAFRRLRGQSSPAEFAAAVRRAGREIGEHVACDARYVGRVEAGEIRCPNYAYERVFRHMFPGRTLEEMGFAPRASVRGRAARNRTGGSAQGTRGGESPATAFRPSWRSVDEENDVLRRALMTGGTAAVAAAWTDGPLAAAVPAQASPARPGGTEAAAVEQAVRQIRVLDDRFGADALYPQACRSLRAAYALLDAGARQRRVADRLHSGAGELAVSVGWLAHDSGRFEDARSHYAEAMATARMAGDAHLEAHAFCNTSFLARDSGHPREAVRAAQAGLHAARGLGSSRLLSLLALREAGGWAGLGETTACRQSLSRARTHFDAGACDADPHWMTFFGEAELEGLECQCWSALGAWDRAAAHARRAVALQPPHFVRNRALFTAQLADDLAALGEPEEAADAATQAMRLLEPVRSTRIRGMLSATAHRLAPHRRQPAVSAFLDGHPLPGPLPA
jgi:tetratricopeptide (TPR) repeat protein